MPSKQYRALGARLQRVFGKQLFFIVGVAKSGTTWLELLLDRHPEIACKGEAHFADLLQSTLADALERYNAKLKVHGGHTNDLSFDAEDSDHLTVTAIALMFAKWADSPDIKIIGEKTPANIRYLPLLNHYFPEAKFVHIIRDGRDAAVSGWFYSLNRNEAYTLETFGDLPGYIRFFSKTWAETIGAARDVAGTLGERYIELRYERLVGAPEQELARVLSFLGADAAPRSIETCLEGARFDELSGGRTPGQEEVTSFFRKGVVGDWQNHFDDADCAAFEENAGALLTELGYT